MKQLLSNLLGSTVCAQDGECGVVKDFYFDDHLWVLRYLVCELTDNSGKRSVLVPSGHFLTKEWDLPVFPVDLTVRQVSECPDPESDLPVSQQKLADLAGTIPWPAVGGIGAPGFLLTVPAQSRTQPGDPHLRSYRVVRGYEVSSSQGNFGSVRDFVVDDRGWEVYSLIVRMSRWLPRKTVMVSPHWASEIDWAAGTIWTNTPAVEWKSAPSFSRRKRPALFPAWRV